MVVTDEDPVCLRPSLNRSSLNGPALDPIVLYVSGGNTQVISALAPLAEMFGYATDLRSRTQGRATFTMQFLHYEPVPKGIGPERTGPDGISPAGVRQGGKMAEAS